MALVSVLALLLAGVTWNLGTWYLGLPVSSSHTLIGSILGVGIANSLWSAGNLDGVNWEKAAMTGVFLLASPIIGFLAAAVLLLVTLALELPMVLLAWRFLGSQDRVRPWLLAAIVGNLISQPPAVLLGTTFDLGAGGGTAVASYVLLETGVIMVEAWVFRWRATSSWTRALLVALVCNAVTALLGAQTLFGN